MEIYNSSIYKKSLENASCSLPKKKANILITGASGLIGSCIVDTLLLAGYNVFALDLRKDRLIERFGKETDKLHFVAQNICDPISDCFDFDYIVHAASFADPKSYALYPAETILVNVVGARNVLDYAKTHENCRVLVTSTFEVYGKLEQDIYKEADVGLLDFNSLRSCYPESKRTTEILVKSYVDEYKTDGVIVRLSSIYGPTMLKNDSKAHAQFLFKALNNEDIVLKSKGEQKRTYTYVVDAVEALLYVLFNGKTGEAYNVANGESIISIAELASLIASLVGRKVVFDLPDELEKKGFSKSQNCILDTTKLTELGYKPKYGIKEGVIETLKIMKECL